MAATCETLLSSKHAFKAAVTERGLAAMWTNFEDVKQITLWSALGLALGYSPHDSSEALTDRWVAQIPKPLCGLVAGDDEDANCIAARRMHLEAWTMVHSEARRLASEQSPEARAPATLGPPDKRARRSEFIAKNANIKITGEYAPAECLFDDLHAMWEVQQIKWQRPEMCPAQLDMDKLVRLKAREDGTGVDSKYARRPRPTIKVDDVRKFELAMHRRSVTMEEMGFISFLEVQRLTTDKYVLALTKDPPSDDGAHRRL